MSDAVDESPDFDRIVGDNIATLRKARGMTQEELAAGVSEHGLSMRQQTVVKIEKGQRPLRLQEADLIGLVLDVSVDSLLAEQVAIDRIALLVGAIRGMNRYWAALSEAVFDLVDAQDALHFAFRVAVERKGLRVDDHVLTEANTLMQIDPLAVTAAALKEREARERLAAAQTESAIEVAPFQRDESGDDE